MSTELGIREGDLPALHQVASDASLDAQRTYLRLVRWDLRLLVGGAFFGAISFSQDFVVRSTAVAALLLLILSLVLTLVISLRAYEEQWYGGRAAAESVKTSAWRYSVGADPYPLDLDNSEADRRFVDQLKSVLDQSEQLRIRLTAAPPDRSQITGEMRRLRQAGLEARKAIYLRDRVLNQQKWYGDRSRDNSTAERRSFIAVTVAQVLAIVAALILVISPQFPINFSGVASTIAAAVFAWLQVKRHQELSQSYAIAANELSMIAVLADGISKEGDFAAFVGDAESAISREHTLWVARRDVPGARKRLR